MPAPRRCRRRHLGARDEPALHGRLERQRQANPGGAWQVEQIRAAILAVWPWVRSDLDRPVLVVAAKDENTMKLLTPDYRETKGRAHPTASSRGRTGTTSRSAPPPWYMRTSSTSPGCGSLNCSPCSRRPRELNPFHGGALAMLANVMAMPPDGRARAVPQAQKAVSVDPSDWFTRVTVARALWNAGQRDIAVS